MVMLISQGKAMYPSEWPRGTTEEVVGDLPRYRLVVGREGNAGFDTRMNGFGWAMKEKRG